MRIVANLDAETHWQRLLAPHRPAAQPSRRVLDLISGFGTLLRAFGGADDPFWTPRPVDPDRLTDRLPIPRLLSGPRPASADLAWGSIDEASARVNHRRFGLELARRLGIELPGSAWVEDLDEALDAVAGLDRWVAKAPLSAAGRERVLGRQGAPETHRETHRETHQETLRETHQSTQRRQLRNLLRRSDGLLIEPWLERVDDFGVLLEIGETSGAVVSMHRQITDERGQFLGIDWQGDASGTSSVGDVADELGRVGEAVGEALRAEGYRGPAGLDAWTWRRRDGSTGLNPLGEINARLSFGWVARQIGRVLGLESVRLRLGSAEGLHAVESAMTLLHPDEDGAGAAWLVP